MIKAASSKPFKKGSRARPQGICGERVPARARLRTRSTRRIAIIVLMAALALECVSGALTTPWLYVKTVTLSGTESLTRNEVDTALRALRIPKRTSMLRAPITPMSRNLAALPFVSSVSVSRRWPNVLEARIYPRQAYALILAAGRHWEVDAQGMVIRRGRPDAKLPLIQSAENSAQPGQRLADESIDSALEISRRLRTMQVPAVEKIVVDPQGQICLNMIGDVIIRLGRAEDLDTKLALAERIFRERPGIGVEFSSVDLSVPEHPACVTRSENERHRRVDNNAIRATGTDSGAPDRHD